MKFSNLKLKDFEERLRTTKAFAGEAGKYQVMSCDEHRLSWVLEANPARYAQYAYNLELRNLDEPGAFINVDGVPTHIDKILLDIGGVTWEIANGCFEIGRDDRYDYPNEAERTPIHIVGNCALELHSTHGHVVVEVDPQSKGGCFGAVVHTAGEPAHVLANDTSRVYQRYDLGTKNRTLLAIQTHKRLWVLSDDDIDYKFNRSGTSQRKWLISVKAKETTSRSRREEYQWRFRTLVAELGLDAGTTMINFSTNNRIEGVCKK